jgi:hypothetical protein
MLDKGKLYYLASPYSKYPDGMVAAFEDISCIAARLIGEGYKLFSPIAHSHPIALYGKLDQLSHDLWLALDEAIMQKCDGIIVAKMDGWETSYGVTWEIDWFRKNKGVEPFYLEPVYE